VLRMEIMGVLLKLIEPNSAQPGLKPITFRPPNYLNIKFFIDKLQDIGKDLLAVRSKVNAEITR